MNEWIQLWERPAAEEMYLVAGWRQWADAGSVSSGLPAYLIDHLGARRIGQMKPDGFYLFQIPGTHHLLRPEIKLEDGYRKKLRSRKNEFFYWGSDAKGLIIFLGEEPHLNAEHYADTLLDAVETLGVCRVVALGGVYGAMPYDKEREVSCIYSLPGMRDDLARYAVKFSDYEGGSTIGTYLADRAEARGIEVVDFYAFIPAYDFSSLTSFQQGLRIETDFRAWYELMRRLNHMFGLRIDLSELKRESDELISTMNARVEDLAREKPHLNIREYMARLSAEFKEVPFIPLDVWEEGLGDLFDDIENPGGEPP